MVAEKLWSRIYGMTDITHSSTSPCSPLHQTHVLLSPHVRRNIKNRIIFSWKQFVPATTPKMVIIRLTVGMISCTRSLAVIACSCLHKDKYNWPLTLTFMTLKSWQWWTHIHVSHVRHTHTHIHGVWSDTLTLQDSKTSCIFYWINLNKLLLQMNTSELLLTSALAFRFE